MIISDIDTGIAVNPAARPSVFTPLSYIQGGLLGRPLDTIDYGTATNPASIANTFDDVLGISVTVALGSTP